MLNPTTSKLLALTKQLCLIESVTGDLQGSEAIIALLREVAPEQATVKTFKSASPGAGSDIMLSLQGEGTGGVLLLGHYDTVPRSPGMELWKEESEWAYGLGACDMKSGLASMMEMLSELSEQTESFSVVHALILGDEEWRSRPPTHRLAPWLGVNGILAFERGQEGAPYSLVHGRYGAAVLHSKVSSEALRAQSPLRGKSAISALAALVDHIQEISIDRAQLAVTSVEAQSVINVIPAEAKCKSIIRYGDSKSIAAVEQALPNNLRGCEISHSFDYRVPLLPATQEGCDMLQLLSGQFPSLEIREETGSADSCWMAEGFPLVFDGLGAAGSGDHSAKERLEISSLLPQHKLASALAGLIIKSQSTRAPATAAASMLSF